MLIKGILDIKTIISNKNWSIHLGIEKGILKSPSDILNQQRFFKTEFNKSKEYLRYITVYDSQVEESNLCHLPVNLTLEDFRYFSSNESQDLSMNYDLKNLKSLPIVIWNYQNTNHPTYKKYEQYFKQEHLISISYKAQDLLETNFKNAEKAFFYKFTFEIFFASEM